MVKVYFMGRAGRQGIAAEEARVSSPEHAAQGGGSLPISSSSLGFTVLSAPCGGSILVRAKIRVKLVS